MQYTYFASHSINHKILHYKERGKKVLLEENGKEHFCLLKKKTFELNNCFHAENTLMGFIFVNAFNFSTKFLVVKSNLLTFCILFLSCGFRHKKYIHYIKILYTLSTCLKPGVNWIKVLKLRIFKQVKFLFIVSQLSYFQKFPRLD